MKKTFAAKSVLSMVLAMLMGVMVPLKAFADAPEYISEVVLCSSRYVDMAVNELKEKGYEACENDLNTGNDGVIVMGYKTTRNPDEAITDMAVMSEKGGYSFDEYKALLERQKDNISVLYDDLKAAIDEFKENYEAEEENAVLAYEMLNHFTNDDLDDMGIGEMFISDTVTDEQIKTVLLQSSTQVVAAIQSCLAVACSSSNWISALPELEEDGTYPASVDDDAAAVLNTIDEFQTGMRKFEGLGITLESTESEIDQFVKNASEEEVYIFYLYSSIYDLIKATDYLGETLYDVLMTDTDTLEKSKLYPMASVMTAGQIATIDTLPLAMSIGLSGVSEFNLDDAPFDNLNELKNLENTISVFAGVDRTIFSPEGIALTTDALRKQQATGESVIETHPLNKIENQTLGIIIMCSSIVAIGGALTLVGLPTIVSDVAYRSGFKFVGSSLATQMAAEAYAAKCVLIFKVAVGVLEAVAVILLVAAITVMLVKKYINSKNHPKYTEMPRILVDEVEKADGSTGYVYYYCAKDTENKLADLNDWNGDKWLGLYTTKDNSAGRPLTADFIVQYGAKNNTAPVGKESFKAVHYFGQTSAFNLNRNSNYKKTVEEKNYIFMFVNQAPAASQSAIATAFTDYGFYGLAALAGLLVGVLATIGIGKARKKKADA